MLKEELDQEKLRQQRKAEAKEVQAKEDRKGTPLGAELDLDAERAREKSELLAEREQVVRQIKEGAERKLEEARKFVADAKAEKPKEEKEEEKQTATQTQLWSFWTGKKKPEPAFLDPSLFKAPQGRKRKTLTIEEAKSGAKRLKADEGLAIALDQEREAGDSLEKARRDLKEVRKRQAVEEKRLANLGKEEKRGRPSKKKAALGTSSDLVPADGSEEERQRRLRLRLQKEEYHGKREDLTPGKRKTLTDFLDIEASKGHHRLGKTFWDRVSRETKVSVHNLKALCTEEGRQLTKDRAALRRKGKGRYWRLVVQQRTQGQRATRPEARGGAAKEEKDKVKQWLQREEQQGHEPEARDLLDQFQVELEDAVFHLEKEEKAWAALSEEEEKEAAEEISEKKARLRSLRQILEKGLATKQSKAYHEQQLLVWTEKVKRKPDLVFPMTEAEGPSRQKRRECTPER